MTTVEIYPTHISINLADEDSNTAWLKTLNFYLENEKGKRFEASSNGITSTGATDSPMMMSHYLESSFFSESKNLTLFITGVTWLDKDMEKIKVDLKNTRADALPQDVTFEKSERKGNSWMLTFNGNERKENAMRQLFMQTYYDENGHEYTFNSWSTGSSSYYDNEKQAYVEAPGIFKVEFSLVGYPYDIVYLSPAYSRIVYFDEPVVIRVK